MNVSVATTKREEPPVCFGSHLWDKNSPECAGGPDANYVNPDNQKNVRYACNFFHSCGTRAAMRGLVPPSQLVRPGLVTPAPAPSPPTFPTAPASGFAEFIKRVEDGRQAVLGRPPGPQPTQPYAQPATHPAASWVLNYAMPSYLSTPEVQHPGESIWQVLLRELIRSLFKAGGHAVAHFFDARTLKRE
jgi:hypothetical protein